MAVGLVQCAVKGDTANGSLWIVGHGKGEFRVGAVSLMRADNVYGMRPEALDAPARTRRPRLPLAGRQLRQRLQLARRHRRPRPPPAAQEPRVERRRAQRFRHGRVHDVLPRHRYRTLHRRQQRARRRAGRRRRGAVCQRRRRYAAWASCARRTATPNPTTSSGGASATRCTATGSSATCRSKIMRKSTTSLPKPCAPSTRRIQLIGVGATGEWSKTMLANCADHMDLLSEHFYCKDKPGSDRARAPDP